MKNYIVKRNEDFILEYKDRINLIEANYADGSIERFSNTREIKENLDNEMMYQYKNYNYNPVISIKSKELIQSLSISLGCSIASLATYIGLNEGATFDDGLGISGASFATALVISSLIIGAARAEKSERDHDKDTLFIDNLELIKEKLKDEEFCKHLPRRVRSKVIDIKTAGEELSLNAVNNFNLRQMEKLVSVCQKEKTKERTR